MSIDRGVGKDEVLTSFVVSKEPCPKWEKAQEVCLDECKKSFPEYSNFIYSLLVNDGLLFNKLYESFGNNPIIRDMELKAKQQELLDINWYFIVIGARTFNPTPQEEDNK